MAYSITNVITDLSGVIHGTTANKIPNIYGIFNRAARAVLLDVDPKETQRIVQMAQVFNNVYDYPLPVDVKGDRIIDLRPQAGRTPDQIFTQGYETNFDANKGFDFTEKIYTQWNSGVKTIRIEAPELLAPITLSNTSSTTGWTATASASNITLDTTNNVAGGGALVFDLAAAGSSGSIQINTLSQIDVTGRVNIDNLFFWVYLPTGSGITSINLKWGSDYTANYYTYTATTTQQGTAFQNGWNLIAMPWASATKVGTPVITAYDSLQLTLVYNGTAQTGVKFCNVTSNTGFIFEIVYYSKFLFRDPSTNAFQETVSDVTDNNKIINLDTESYNLFFNKVAFFTAQSLQGADADYDASYWDAEYDKALARYKALNPSEAMLKGSTYYDVPRKGYGTGSRFLKGPNSQ